MSEAIIQFGKKKEKENTRAWHSNHHPTIKIIELNTLNYCGRNIKNLKAQGC